MTSAPSRSCAASSSPSFDFILGDRSIEWYSPKDAARICGMSERFILEAYEAGKISGHSHNAGTERKRKPGSSRRRDTKRIPRWWLAGYLAQTADYDGAMKLSFGRQTLDAYTGDRHALVELRRHIDSLLTR